MKTIADVIREQFEVPEGYDQLYVRSIKPGKANQYGFEWPCTPGSTVTTSVVRSNTTGCPWGEGDGFCLATTHAVMATGIFTTRTLLVVAVREEDIVGSEQDGQKIRVRHAVVVACVNGSKLVRRFGAGMDLRWANLIGANLTGANLTGACLTGAYLAGAYLAGADLTRAHLTDAILTDAILADAHLTGAYLFGANLFGANLTGAHLTGADLTWVDLAEANLASANLTGANLTEADLAVANLTGAHLFGTNLRGAYLAGADLTRANIEDAIR